MFGCIGGFVRLIFVVVILVVLGGAAYFFLSRSPEKATLKGGVAAVQEKVESVKLVAEVKTALSLRESFKSLDISVSAEKDVITLRGKVPSAEVSKTVEGVASSVPGVRQIVNFLEVDPAAGTAGSGDDRTMGEKMDDQTLELKVRAAFKLDKELSTASFEITSIRKSLRISSSTATAAQKKRAVEVARTVEGVVTAEAR
jgi:hyperosmotically inducible protein